jgi:hypothetical protein
LQNDKNDKDYSEAVAKIEAEIASSNGASYVKAIGNFRLQHINTHPRDAAKILDEGKTIKGSLGEMRKVAEKQKVDSCACLSDAEGFSIVLKYYGIEAGADPVQERAVGAPAATEQKPDIDFDVRLEDLL